MREQFPLDMESNEMGLGPFAVFWNAGNFDHFRGADYKQ